MDIGRITDKGEVGVRVAVVTIVHRSVTDRVRVSATRVRDSWKGQQIKENCPRRRISSVYCKPYDSN